MISDRVASSVAQRQVRYVDPVAPGRATGRVAAIYAQVRDEMKLIVPPVSLHSPAPDTLAAFWMLMREPLTTRGVVDRTTKEAVAAAVSLANACPYCLDMHSTGLYDLSSERDAEAVVADRIEEVDDDAVRWGAGWGRGAHVLDGPPLDPSVEPAARAELVGVAVSFHYLTRMVNVFLPGYLVPARLGPRSRRRMKRGISALLRPMLRTAREPARSLRFLPEAKLPADAGWAAGNEAIAAAVARAYAALDAAGARSLSPAVRTLVCDHLSTWRGDSPGISRQWCDQRLDGLVPPDAAAARLALLTAVASYQVDEQVVDEFRRHHPGDAVLVRAVAWASFAAARLIGSRHLARSDDTAR